MGTGEKIKEYRLKNNLTQKKLADLLNVTYQAVSRWENNEVEPSIDTIKEMSKIFKCTTDDLLGIEKEATEVPECNEMPKEEEKKQERVVIGVCEQCNKPIFNGEQLNRIEYKVSIRQGRTHHYEMHKKILCEECNRARIVEEIKTKEKNEIIRKQGLKKKRIYSIIFPLLAMIIMLVIGIVLYTGGDSKTGLFFIISGILVYPFLGCIILNNNFIPDLWLEIANWGFVKMPGVIMEFSLDGIIIGIIIKIILWLFGILIAIAAVLFATVIALPISVFAYPFALGKNIKNIK